MRKVNQLVGIVFISAMTLLDLCATVDARTQYLTYWSNTKYPNSTSDSVSCALCHGRNSNGTDNTSTWNAYGTALKQNGLSSSTFDTTVIKSALEAVEGLNSDLDPGGFSNLNEINSNTQPGWKVGDTNAPSAALDPFSYTLSNSGGITVTQGASGSNTITRTLVSGATQTVTLSNTLSGLPAGATFGGFTNNPCAPTCSSTLTINTSASTPVGTYQISVTGSPLNRTTTFNLVVNPAPFSYTLSSSGTITVRQGLSGSNTITRTLVSGATQTVTLSNTLSGLPAGATFGGFTNNPCAPTCSSTLTINTSASTPVGTYQISVTGSPLNRTTTFNLVVTPPQGSLQFKLATFSVSESGGSAPITITRMGGSSGVVGVTLQTSNGTATAGTDYSAVTQTVTFANGDTADKTVNVPIINDTTVEGNETINLSFVSVTGGATLGSPSSATLSIIDDDFAAVSNLGNISTRGRVMTGDNIMIGGFIIEGSAPSRVLVRSRGPSLGGQPFNLPGTLANPLLQLFSGAAVIAQNDNWQDAPNCPGFLCEDATAIINTGLDPCTPNPGQTAPPPNCAFEAAILITLPPGAYTAIVSGADGGIGLGLVEVFEEDTNTASGLSNISTRGFVQTGDNVLIGGLIIGGTTPATVLLRGRGPSMSGAPFSIPGTLADPFLQLFSGSTVIAQNNNWQDSPACDPGFVCESAVQISASGLSPCDPNPGQSTSPPGCAQEAAILITLPPGGYTAMLSGVGGGTGVGLIEVFDRD